MLIIFLIDTPSNLDLPFDPHLVPSVEPAHSRSSCISKEEVWNFWEFGSVMLDLVLLRGPQQWMCCPPGVVLFWHSDMVSPLACAGTGEGVSGMLDVLEHEVSHRGELAHILLETHGGEKTH